MTTIAWDGKTLAADKQASVAEMRAKVTKIRRLDSGDIVAFTGSYDYGMALAKLYEEGDLLTNWPAFQADKDNWTRLIVVNKHGLRVYERLPVALWFEEPFIAFGSGRDYAMGAMARGATAREAVLVANQFCIDSGLGVDSFEAP